MIHKTMYILKRKLFSAKKEDKGITLIALIVTIVILLILASISILALTRTGLFKKATQAKQKTENAQELENSILNEYESQIKELGGISSTKDKTGLVTKITLDKTSITMERGSTEILTATIEPSNANIKWSSNNESIVTVDKGTITAKAVGTAIITATAQDESGIAASCTINVIKPEFEEGDYVIYDSGKNGKILCRVLYEKTSAYGLQIVSNDIVNDVTLGGKTWEDAKKSYNNAIETLNNEANNYLNETYATDTRCVGSNPSNKNSEITTTPTLPAEWKGIDKITGIKWKDANYSSDQKVLNRIKNYRLKKEYWLASRGGTLNLEENVIYFYVRGVGTVSGDLGDKSICMMNSNGTTSAYDYTFGFRPCIILKPEIKTVKGDGSSTDPYEIGV